MLTVLRAAGGWSLEISPPDPRLPPAQHQQESNSNLGQWQWAAQSQPCTGHIARTPNLAPLPWSQSLGILELPKSLREDFTITEKAPTRLGPG